MMEKSVFTQRVKRLQEVAAVVEKLPSEIRMAAFELLKLYVTESSLSKPKQSESHQDGGDKTSIDPSDIADFFGRFETSKPGRERQAYQCLPLRFVWSGGVYDGLDRRGRPFSRNHGSCQGR